MNTYTPTFFYKYGIEFCYFNKFLLFDLNDLNKSDITASVYYTIYSNRFNRPLSNAEQQLFNNLKQKSEIGQQNFIKSAGQNQDAQNRNADILKSTQEAVNNWFTYLKDLEYQCFENFGFAEEIKEMKQKSLAFQVVSDRGDNGQLSYVKDKYEFLEKLYWHFVYSFLSCVHTLYWEKVNNDDLLVLSKFISGGEAQIIGRNPNNSNDLQIEFFGNKRRSKIPLEKCMKLAIKMNQNYLTELRRFADLQFPSELDMTKILPSVKGEKKKKKNK